jgi:hypothetical protein
MLHSNLIYKAFIDFAETERPWFRITFHTDSNPPRYVEFFDGAGVLLHKAEIDLPHNDYLKQSRELKDFYRRLKNSEMGDK